MTEHTTEIVQRLVIGRKRDGRNCYDPEAKRELVEACLRPGVSVARLAMQHGVNANLLRIWIGRYRKKQESGLAMPAPFSAFVPVVTAKLPALAGRSGLQATLPNGVRLDLGGMDGDALVAVLNCLARLSCSASTPD
jgi:transposase